MIEVAKRVKTEIVNRNPVACCKIIRTVTGATLARCERIYAGGLHLSERVIALQLHAAKHSKVVLRSGFPVKSYDIRAGSIWLL